MFSIGSGKPLDRLRSTILYADTSRAFSRPEYFLTFSPRVDITELPEEFGHDRRDSASSWGQARRAEYCHAPSSLGLLHFLGCPRLTHPGRKGTREGTKQMRAMINTRAMTSTGRRQVVLTAAVSLLCATGLVVASSSVSQAGNYTELEQTATLAAGGSVNVHRSPLNQGAAMEMDYTDFQTGAGGGSYRVTIAQNSTGRALNLRLLGVNATIIEQCTTAVNGTCTTATLGLGGNLDFGTVVASQNAAPVNTGGHYSLSVIRVS